MYLQTNLSVSEVRNFFKALPQKGLSIYDFGCGSKPYKEFAGENKYIRTDIDTTNEKADIFCSIDNDIANMVCSFYVLEHVYNPLDVLKEKFRVLKPRGTLFMLVPLYWEEHEQPFDFYRYTKFSLRKMLEEAGYLNVDIKPINANWAILGMNFVRLLNSRKYMRFIVPLLHYLFFRLDQKMLRSSSVDKISNVMSYAIVAGKSK